MSKVSAMDTKKRVAVKSWPHGENKVGYAGRTPFPLNRHNMVDKENSFISTCGPRMCWVFNPTIQAKNYHKVKPSKSHCNTNKKKMR